MKKNVASQKVGAQMVSATDGSAFTGAVVVSVTGDAGTQATGSVGSGACTHEGLGYHTYAPAQAETNYDLIAFTFVGTGAINTTLQVYTSFPQNGDSFDRIGSAGAGLTAIDLPNQAMDIVGNITGNLSGSVGSVVGAVGSIAAGGIDSASFASQAITNGALATNAISASKLAADASVEIAGAVWDEDATAHQTTGTFGQAIGDPVADTNTIFKAVVTDAAGATVGVDVVAVKVDTAAILVDTGTTLDAALAVVDANVDAILVDTAEIGAAGAGLTAVPWNASWDAEVQSEATDALNAYDPPTNTEMDARTLPAANYATATAVDAIDNFLDTEVADVLIDTSTTLDDMVDDLEGRLTAALATALQAHSLAIGRVVIDAGSTTTAVVFELVNGSAASAVNDFYNGRAVIFTSGALTLQATSITDYVGATKTATVPALTSAPADDVTAVLV